MDYSSYTICVCGAGTMGSGIAQVFAQHGFNTILFDVNAGMLANAREKIEKKLPGAPVRYTSVLQECRGRLIIEAIVEKAEIKSALLNDLMAINESSTVYATNTSSLSVTAIADKLLQPQRFLGIHFFNPAPVMKLVEIVRTHYVAQELIDEVKALISAIGKTAVLCQDAPGFIVNHVARPYYLEALYLHEKYGLDYEHIDSLMQASGFKMGPFRLMDLIGNDINYSVSCIVHEALGQPLRLQPSPIQKAKVDSGHLGRKSGKGYYEYSNT